MSDTYEHTFGKPQDAAHRRRLIERQQRYFETQAGERLEVVEIETGPQGEITVRWRRKGGA